MDPNGLEVIKSHIYRDFDIFRGASIFYPQYQSLVCRLAGDLGIGLFVYIGVDEMVLCSRCLSWVEADAGNGYLLHALTRSHSGTRTQIKIRHQSPVTLHQHGSKRRNRLPFLRVNMRQCGMAEVIHSKQPKRNPVVGMDLDPLHSQIAKFCAFDFRPGSESAQIQADKVFRNEHGMHRLCPGEVFVQVMVENGVGDEHPANAPEPHHQRKNDEQRLSWRVAQVAEGLLENHVHGRLPCSSTRTCRSLATMPSLSVTTRPNFAMAVWS